MTAEFEKTNSFLREHAGRALAQAITTREAAITQPDTPPPVTPQAFAFTPGLPNRSGAPSLSELLTQLDTDQSGGSDPDASWLDDQADAWISTHFPNIDDGFTRVPNDWVADVLAESQDFGVNLEVLDSIWGAALERAEAFGELDTALLGVDFSNIWVKGRLWVKQAMPAEDEKEINIYKRVFDRARDRAEATRRSEFNTIEAGYAARGFSLPPGAMVAALDEATQRSVVAPLEVDVEQAVRQAEIAQGLDQVALQTASQQALALADTRASVRTESIRTGSAALEKNADIQADFIRVAAQLSVQIAYQFRIGILQAMAEFHRGWVDLLSDDPKLNFAKTKSDAISNFYQAVSRFHTVDAEFERIRIAAEQNRIQASQLNNQNQIELYSLRERRADSLGQAVRGFGDISAAAANAAGSLTAQIESI